MNTCRSRLLLSLLQHELAPVGIDITASVTDTEGLEGGQSKQREEREKLILHNENVYFEQERGGDRSLGRLVPSQLLIMVN